jgi:hypothetical protein
MVALTFSKFLSLKSFKSCCPFAISCAIRGSAKKQKTAITAVNAICLMDFISSGLLVYSKIAIEIRK